MAPEHAAAHTRASLGVVPRRRKRKDGQSFASDPEVPPIMQEAGHKGRPQVPVLSGSYEA
jgi:hypothetical protein